MTMARLVEATIKISDLEQLKDLLGRVSAVVEIYETMGHHLGDTQLAEALEGLLTARNALRDL